MFDFYPYILRSHGSYEFPYPYILRPDGLYECPFCGEVFSREWLEMFGCCMHCSESLQYLTT